MTKGANFKRTLRFLFPMVLISCFAVLTPYAHADEGTSILPKKGLKRILPRVQNPFSRLQSDEGPQPRVTPHLYADSSYNSNATLSKKSHGAWQGRVSPGVTVDVPMGDKLYGAAGYTYSFSTTQGKHISTHNNSHNVDAMLRYDISKDTAVGAHNNLQWSELPGSPGKNFMVETAHAEGKHRFGDRLSSGVDYVFQHFRDVTPVGTTTTRDTFNDNSASAHVDYDVASSLTVSPNFNWHVRHFTKTNTKDYWEITPAGDATFQLGPKTKVSGRIGWSYRDFDKASSQSELIYGAGLSHLLGRKMVWQVNYDKSLQDTFDTRFIFREGATATNLDNYDRQFRVIKVHRLGTSAIYNLNEKNSFGLFGDFLFSKTNTGDNILGTGKNNEKIMEAGAQYLIRVTRYLSFNLLYSFGRNFESKNNPARNTYTFHKITGGVIVSF